MPFHSLPSLQLYMSKIVEQPQLQYQALQYQAVKKHGYYLAQPINFTLPTASRGNSLVNNLLQVFKDDSYQKSIFRPSAPKVCTILDEKIAAISHSNKLTIIYYTISEKKLSIQSKCCFLLNDQIKRVLSPYDGTRFQSIQNHQYFMVVSQNTSTLTVFKVDQYLKVTKSQEIKLEQKIMAVRFIAYNQVLVLLGNCLVCQYFIKQGKLTDSNLCFRIMLDEDHILKNAQICMPVIQGKQKICLLYLVYQKANQKYVLHLKQYGKDNNNQIKQLGIYYEIFQYYSTENCPQLPIESFGECILFHLNLTVFVIQKKLGRYVKSDLISQLSGAQRIMVINKKNNLFVCSIGKSEIELYQMKIKDVGCKLHLIDVIEADQSVLARQIIKTWIFTHSKKPEFMLMINNGARNIDFYLAIKTDKLTKLTDKVKRQQKQMVSEALDFKKKNMFMSRVKQIEELGLKLGFNRREFYLKLWHQSQKKSSHIIQFLLPCRDLKIIFNQITYFLRIKKLTVVEIIRILKKIQRFILEEIKIKLDLQLIRQFFKTNFQRRKLKLYNGDISLDFLQYQNIYESSLFDLIHRSIDLHLFPQKFKNDIIWRQQIKENPIHIPNILREFRLAILEDYPAFIKRLLEPNSNNMSKIIEAFPFLLPKFPLKISIVKQEQVMLSNIYQQQKIEEEQYAWLGYIRQNQWEKQSSSIDFLTKHLFEYHATSTINETIRLFRQSHWFIQNKYQKHTFIEIKKGEFQDKLLEINDGSSLLFICQKANRIALLEKKESQGQNIIKIMKRCNHLMPSQFYQYRLFCNLHYILIRQGLIQQNTTITELMKMQKQKLVACFFLGNHERVNLLFSVIARQYSSKETFNNILQRFIMSEQCSKVELEILTNYVIREGQKFQEENQQLIKIMVNGYLKRIEIRQKDKSEDFLIFFKNLALSQSLLIQMDVFQSIRTECANILKIFGLNSLSYQIVIQQPFVVINGIVHQFFSNTRLRNKSIYIEGRQVNLAQAQNLFAIILYLKDKIYSFHEQMEIYLIFCETILQWNQFQLLRECFNEDITIDQKVYYSEQFYGIVVEYMLSKYYEDEQLVYNTQTKEHIYKLLSLIDISSEIYIIETAKIQFVNCLQSLNRSISIQYMQIIKDQWEKQDSRSQLFKDIIDLFGEDLNFQTIINLYQKLQKIRTGTTNITVKTEQFVEFCNYVCKKYAKFQQYQQISQVIYFLNHQQHQYKTKHNIMTQCFLQTLNIKLQASHEIRESYLKVDKATQLTYYKQLIDFYLENYHIPQKINQFFNSRFEKPSSSRYYTDQILVDPEITASQSGIRISISKIWQIVTNRAINISNNFNKSFVGKQKSFYNKEENISKNALDSKTILFTYFFICNIFKDISYLIQLEEISYNHAQNIVVLEEMYKNIGFRNTMDFKKIYLHYLKGLFKMHFIQLQLKQEVKKQSGQLPVLQRSPSNIDDKIKDIKNMSDSKLIIIINDFPPDKSNSPVIKAMKRLVPLYHHAQKLHHQRQQNLNTLKTLTQHEENSQALFFEEKEKRDMHESINQMTIPRFYHENHKKTFKYIEFEGIKKQLLSKSNLVNQKMVIQKVFEELENNASRSYDISEVYIEQEKSSIKKVFINEQSANILKDAHEDQYQQIIIDMDQIKNMERDEGQFQQIKDLIQNKEYPKIISNFPMKSILKYVDQEYYTQMIPQSKLKRRLIRSNTIKQSALNSRMSILLQLLDALKLYNYPFKIRHLRSCLIVVSTDELLSIQECLLRIFRLNIVLDQTKNIPFVIKTIIKNVKNSNFPLQLTRFKTIVSIVTNFIRRCKQDVYQRHHHQKTNEIAELYLEYILKLKDSNKGVEKAEDLQQIMIILGKQQLLTIHQRVLQALSGDLYVDYLVLIHTVFLEKKI